MKVASSPIKSINYRRFIGQTLLIDTLATGFLVIAASFFGLPVSTTHVSVGSLFGVGLITKQANIGTVSTILLSWVITLPCAAILAGLIFWIADKL